MPPKTPPKTKDKKASVEPIPVPEPEPVAPPEPEPVERFPDSPRESKKKLVFSFPPKQLLHNNSYWKELVNYKHPPGHSHAMRHKLTTTLKKPLPEDLCSSLRASLGEENYKVLEEAIDIQAINLNALKKADEKDSKDGKDKNVDEKGIYKRVWKGPLDPAFRDTATQRLAELNQEAMKPVPSNKEERARAREAEKEKEKERSGDPTQPQVSSFEDWFNTYGEVKHNKIPTAALLKQGTNWNPRRDTTILPLPQFGEMCTTTKRREAKQN